MAEEWALGRGFGQTKAKDIPTDGQQAGEVAFHGESLTGGKGPGGRQSVTPGSTPGHSGRRVGVKRDVNGFGGGVKSTRYPEGQAVSGSINRDTGHGEPFADGEKADATLDKVAPSKGHVAYRVKG
jgi:hypothetical protein